MLMLMIRVGIFTFQAIVARCSLVEALRNREKQTRIKVVIFPFTSTCPSATNRLSRPAAPAARNALVALAVRSITTIAHRAAAATDSEDEIELQD